MDRDTAHVEAARLIQQYRKMPFADLYRLANTGEIETSSFCRGELITLSVDVRRRDENSVRIHVSAYGNNWWKQERVDESAVVTRDGNHGGKHETVSETT